MSDAKYSDCLNAALELGLPGFEVAKDAGTDSRKIFWTMNRLKDRQNWFQSFSIYFRMKRKIDGSETT